MKPTVEQVHDALKTILADKEHYSTSLNYAVNYCRQGLLQTNHELEVQCLYILGNITGWRHPKAKEVKETLKAFSKNL